MVRKVGLVGLVWGGLVRIVAAWVGGGGGLVMAGSTLAGRDWCLLVLRHDEDGGEGRGEVLLLNPVERRETDAQSRVCTSFYTITNSEKILICKKFSI